MFSFLPLINNSGTIGLGFFLLSISTIISPKTINILRFLFGLNKSFRIIKMLFKRVLFLLLIKNWYFASYGSLVYKYVLLISGCQLIRLKNEFVFPNPEPPVINILYGSSWIYDQFVLYAFVSSFITSSKLITFCIVLLYWCI